MFLQFTERFCFADLPITSKTRLVFPLPETPENTVIPLTGNFKFRFFGDPLRTAKSDYNEYANQWNIRISVSHSLAADLNQTYNRYKSAEIP